MNFIPSGRTANTFMGQSRLGEIPWLALASLLVVLMCIGTSISIIAISNSQTVESWKIQPAVLLAILASISNVALGTAFSAAVVIIWWTSALDGTSLAQLHYIWDRGEGLSFFSALAAGNNARRVALAASIIVVVKLTTTPLLQRATYQRIDEMAVQQTIKLDITQLFPDKWFTMSTPRGTLYSTTPQSQRLLQDWWKSATINSTDEPGYYCDGTCEGNVPGAGIYYNCTSTTQTLDLFASSGMRIFEINTTMSENSTGSPFLLLTTLHSSAIDDNCIATLTIDTCKIEAGIVEYPVILQNSSVKLNNDKLDDITVLSTYIYPEDFGNMTLLGPLTFLDSYIGDHLSSRSRLYVTRSAVQAFTDYGEIFMYLFYDSIGSDQIDNYCSLMWFSPTKYLLNSMQNVMFRAALLAAGATDVQTFAVRRTKPALAFHSAYGHLAAASIITLLGLLITLIMLQGWWVLGRTVTLSPLETAKTFRAPLMEHASSNVTVDGILGDAGQIWVKYVDGVIMVDENRDIERPAQEKGQLHAEGGNGETSCNINEVLEL